MGTLGSAGWFLAKGAPGDGTPVNEGASIKGSGRLDGMSVPPSAVVDESSGVFLVRSPRSPWTVEGWVSPEKYEGGSGKARGAPRYDDGYNTSMILLVEGSGRQTCLRWRDLGGVLV